MTVQENTHKLTSEHSTVKSLSLNDNLYHYSEFEKFSDTEWLMTHKVYFIFEEDVLREEKNLQSLLFMTE